MYYFIVCRFKCCRSNVNFIPIQWRSQPKILRGAKMFDFWRITLFCLERRLSKHKMTVFQKFGAGHGPFAPSPLSGYVYVPIWLFSRRKRSVFRLKLLIVKTARLQMKPICCCWFAPGFSRTAATPIDSGHWLSVRNKQVEKIERSSGKAEALRGEDVPDEGADASTELGAQPEQWAVKR